MHYSLYWVFIKRDYRVFNLAIEVTTHGTSIRYGILTFVVHVTSAWSVSSVLRPNGNDF